MEDKQVDAERGVVCPECRAAIGAACTEQGKPFGLKFVGYYHSARTLAVLVEGATV